MRALVHSRCVFFARVCFSRLSLFFPLSSLCTNKQNEQLFVQQKHVFRQNRLNRLLSTKSGVAVLFSKEKPDFSRHTDFGSHLFFFVFFLSFFLFERFLFERERTFLRFRARESKSAQKNTERDLFLIRKCPPRNKNGNKMKRLS